MAFELSGFELSFVVREMQELAGAKVDKIFETGKDEFYIRVHKTGLGKRILRIALPSLFYISSLKKDSSGHPGGFCMFLRKKLANARVAAIDQLRMERIVKLRFEAKEESYMLVLELFGKGNIILCSQEGSILSCLYNHDWKTRVIKPKQIYSPPQLKQPVDEMPLEDFRKIVSKPGKNKLVSFIASDLGLGGKYSKEFCLRYGFSEDAPLGSFSEADIQKIHESLGSFLSTMPKPGIVRDGDSVVDFAPFQLKIYESLSFNPQESLNSAIYNFFASSG